MDKFTLQCCKAMNVGNTRQGDNSGGCDNVVTKLDQYQIQQDMTM